MHKPPKEYDGLYFLPGEEDGQMEFSFFNMTEQDYNRIPIENTEIGDKFHIAFFKQGDSGHVVLDEHFEAIFADPLVYLRGLIGSDLYGCAVRKTKSSTEWFQNYLKHTGEVISQINDSLKHEQRT